MFLDFEICNKILTIGKSVDFIKKKCEITDWQLNADNFNIQGITDLNPFIENIYVQTNKKLLSIINC